MRLDVRLRPWSSSLYRESSFIWDSESGELGGDLAEVIRAEAERARQVGSEPAGPQFGHDYPIKDPLHRPDEMAVILRLLEFVLPPELAACYPAFPDPLAGLPASARAAIQL